MMAGSTTLSDGAPKSRRPGSGTAVPHQGMPPLDLSGPPLSFFEFWPMRRFYWPLFLYCVWLGLRFRGPTLITAANPRIEGGGLCGESKAAILDQAGPTARAWIAPYVTVHRLADASATEAAAHTRMASAGLAFPLVAKPDIGCRGVGVRVVADAAQLSRYIAQFPVGETLLLQALVDEEGEAGIFYVRRPPDPRHGQKATESRILSITLKYFPRVIGDGRRTLRALIEDDPRAGQIAHIYLPRHGERLDTVVPAGETVRLAFAGSHSRGAIFRDGTALATEAMRARFDAIAQDFPEFWFGRFDVRFADSEALRRGEGFRIIEVNGVGGEATHVWDRNMSIWQAYRDLAEQYRLAFEIGAINRRRGFAPTSLLGLWRLYRRHARLMPLYPPTQ